MDVWVLTERAPSSKIRSRSSHLLGTFSHVGRPWPWRELRNRDHIELRFDPVADLAGGAVYGRLGDQAVIVISPALDQTERRCALAHELVHDDLGIVAPPATDLTMQRVEHMTRRRTAEWLLPIDDLAVWVRARAEIEPVTAELVAREFDVTPDIASHALRLVGA